VGAALSDVKNDTWELVLGELSGPLAFTPTLDGQRALGPNYVIVPGQTLDIYPHFTKEHGTVGVFQKDFASKALGNTRMIRMYLPPSYDENTVARYPVIYMHDGQTIFDESLGVTDGPAKSAFGSWRAELVMDEGVKWGTLPEAIVIGIDVIIQPGMPSSIGAADLANEFTKVRVQELTPTRDDDSELNIEETGKGPDYLRMIREELKPMVDAKLRTRPEREGTFMAGSSLGGLISLWAGLYHGDIFGGVFGMSNSTFWDDEVLLERVKAENGGPARATKIYVDTSDYELGPKYPDKNVEVLEQHKRLFQGYKDVGYVGGTTLVTLVANHTQKEEVEHNGKYWSQRLPAALAFLLGSGR
jgi:predicted alpha/beta superfamily hydrolase